MKSNVFSPISPAYERNLLEISDISYGNYDIIIVGAGLWGSMIQKYFSFRGCRCLIIDSENRWAASKCSVGVSKDGWLGTDIEKAKESFSVMDKLFGGVENVTMVNMDNEDFNEENFYWMNPKKILNEDYLPAKVMKVDDKNVWLKDMEGNRIRLTAHTAVIVAAGAWTSKIISTSPYADKAPKIDSYWGANYDLKLKTQENRYATWAPYKHSLLFNFNDFTRFSDGNTVKNPSIEDKRLEKFTDRLSNNLTNILYSKVSQDKFLRINEGVRPYTEKGDFIRRYSSGLYSATGGRKNSSALAGYIAKTLFEKIYNQ